MVIRRYRVGEEEELWRLYYDTTHRVNRRDYTEAQCERWAPADKDMGEWRERIAGKNPLVAEAEGRIVGFAELEGDGHIDFFYCRHDYQGRGAGRALMAAIEAEARRMGMGRLHARVSVTAKVFFVRMGFVVVKEQFNVVCGSVAPNFLMEKVLE
jgi:GNAT superfamily N-acetyltransferase